MNFMQTFLQRGRQPKPKVQHFVCREDLNKKKTASLKVKKKVHFESKPLIQHDQNEKNCETEDPREGDEASNEEKSTVRVKILMKKEEATLLLSKCKNGGVLQLDDVPNMLVHFPNRGLHAFSCNEKDD